MKREYNVKTTDELIYFCDCNNNITEQITNTSAAGQQPGTVIYVDDPVVTGSKCIKKQENTYLSLRLFNTKEKQTSSSSYYKVFVDCETASHNDTTGTYTYILGHRIEFDYMLNSFSSYTYSGGSIIEYCAQGNQNANAKYPGFALVRRNRDSKIYVVYKNNNTTSGFQYYEFECELSRWYHVSIQFNKTSDTSYNATIAVKDTVSGDNETFTTIDFTSGSWNTNNRGCFNFFSDSWGYGSWSDNPIDYLKNVAIYKIDE